MSLTTVDSKQLIQDYWKALSGQPKGEELLDRYVADPALKEHIRQAEAAFPCYQAILRQVVAEGDLVAARVTFLGIHKGEFAGIPATGRHVSSDFMIFYRIEAGRIAEHWMQLDIHDILRQLNA